MTIEEQIKEAKQKVAEKYNYNNFSSLIASMYPVTVEYTDEAWQMVLESEKKNYNEIYARLSDYSEEKKQEVKKLDGIIDSAKDYIQVLEHEINQLKAKNAEMNDFSDKQKKQIEFLEEANKLHCIITGEVKAENERLKEGIEVRESKQDDHIILYGEKGISAKLGTVQYIPYQECPVCKGEGLHTSPHTTSNGYLNTTCKVCKGEKIIPMHIVKE